MQKPLWKGTLQFGKKTLFKNPRCPTATAKPLTHSLVLPSQSEQNPWLQVGRQLLRRVPGCRAPTGFGLTGNPEKPKGAGSSSDATVCSAPSTSSIPVKHCMDSRWSTDSGSEYSWTTKYPKQQESSHSKALYKPINLAFLGKLLFRHKANSIL